MNRFSATQLSETAVGVVLEALSIFTCSRCLLSSAKKLGVTEVPLEVVNFISHATQSRLRSLLEKVSAVSQHRTDGAKVRMSHSHLQKETRRPEL